MRENAVRALFEVPVRNWAAAIALLLLAIHLYEWTRPTEVEVINHALESVVAIECHTAPTFEELIKNVDARGTTILTAGFVASKHGHILTVAHGLSECLGSNEKNLVVRFWENPAIPHRAKILRYNKYHDVGLLQVSTTPDDIDPLVISHREYLPGTTAIALGHPEFLQWSASRGIISAERLWGEPLKTVVQVSSLINQGNSGGPSITSSGEVIGIASFNIGGNPTLGFLIPGSTLEYFMRGITK